MAEFIEVMKQRKRMCDSVSSCYECPMSSVSNGACREYAIQHPQIAEKIIMKWAKENHIKTNAEKFEEVFGYEPVNCPFVCDNKFTCDFCDFKDFWVKEYKD